MKKRLSRRFAFISLILLAAVSGKLLLAGGSPIDDVESRYLGVIAGMNTAEKLASDEHYAAALATYHQVALKLNYLRADYPEWQTELTAYRAMKISVAQTSLIERLKE